MVRFYSWLSPTLYHAFYGLLLLALWYNFGPHFMFSFHTFSPVTWQINYKFPSRQAHSFWDSGAGVEMASPTTPDVIVPTEAEVDSAVQVATRVKGCHHVVRWFYFFSRSVFLFLTVGRCHSIHIHIPAIESPSLLRYFHWYTVSHTPNRHLQILCLNRSLAIAVPNIRNMLYIISRLALQPCRCCYFNDSMKISN